MVNILHTVTSFRVDITSSPQQRVFALVWGHCWVTLALTWPLLVLQVRGEWTEEHICLDSLTFLSLTPYLLCFFFFFLWFYCSALKSISKTVSVLYPFWKSLQTFGMDQELLFTNKQTRSLYCIGALMKRNKKLYFILVVIMKSVLWKFVLS